MNFHEWVSQETAAYGSQKEAAAAYGLSQTQWSRYTRGASVGEATLARLRERAGLDLVVEPPDEALEHVDQVDEDDPERAELLELHAEIEAEGEDDEQDSAREAGELLAEGLALVIARGDRPGTVLGGAVARLLAEIRALDDEQERASALQALAEASCRR